jgi:hypothetical protein
VGLRVVVTALFGLPSCTDAGFRFHVDLLGLSGYFVSLSDYRLERFDGLLQSMDES